MNSRAEELGKIIETSARAKQLLESDTWKQVFEPIIDAMIIDTLGGKIDGRWVNGSIDKVEEVEEKLRYLQAYKAALVAVHSAFYQLIDDGNDAYEELQKINQLEKDSKLYEGSE